MFTVAQRKGSQNLHQVFLQVEKKFVCKKQGTDVTVLCTVYDQKKKSRLETSSLKCITKSGDKMTNS